MTGEAGPELVVESDPDPQVSRFLDEQLYAFNIETSGVRDDRLLAVLLRGPDGEMRGGSFGWTWGGTCYVRQLFVPPEIRGQGYGTKIMAAIEREAMARGCRQMLLETHSFQAPDFYRGLGFAVIGSVDEYPRGHRYLTMLKRL